eukprot:10630468-Ditylum_brightwellii.AAC.1
MSPTRKKYGCPNASSILVGISFLNKDSLLKHFKDAKAKHSANSGLCGDLNDLKRHMSSVHTG